MGEGWLTPRSGFFSPRKETRYPLYMRLGRPHGRSERLRNISPPSGFDPRTVHPVASRCTDWAIVARNVCVICFEVFDKTFLFRQFVLLEVIATRYTIAGNMQFDLCCTTHAALHVQVIQVTAPRGTHAQPESISWPERRPATPLYDGTSLAYLSSLCRTWRGALRQRHT